MKRCPADGAPDALVIVAFDSGWVGCAENIIVGQWCRNLSSDLKSCFVFGFCGNLSCDLITLYCFV